MLASETDTMIRRTIDRAKRAAKSAGEIRFVCSIDDGGEFGERSIIVARQEYVDADEFEAFDGRIIHVVAPDGSVD